MTVIKNQKSNTYEVRTYYKDWTGVRKQKTKRGFKRKGNFTENSKEKVKKYKEEIIEILKKKQTIDEFITDNDYETNVYPLTDVQAAYLVGKTEAVKWGGIGCKGYIEVDFGSYSAEELSRAWKVLVNRHEMLRAKVTEVGFEILERDEIDYEIKIVNLQKMAEREKVDTLSKIREDFSEYVFHTEEPPLFKVLITKRIEGNFFHLLVDLIVSDFASVQLLISEMGELLKGASLEKIRYKFSDYAMFNQQRKGSLKWHQDRMYWLERLKKLPEAPILPQDGRAADKCENTYEFYRFQKHINQSDWKRIKEIAGEYGVTVSSVLIGIYAEVISRWSSNKHFTLNLPIQNRPTIGKDTGMYMAPNIQLFELDIDKESNIGKFFKGSDLVIGAIGPSADYSEKMLLEAMAENIPYVDPGGIHLIRKMRNSSMKGTAIVGSGIFPGLSGWMLSSVLKEAFNDDLIEMIIGGVYNFSKAAAIDYVEEIKSYKAGIPMACVRNGKILPAQKRSPLNLPTRISKLSILPYVTEEIQEIIQGKYMANMICDKEIIALEPSAYMRTAFMARLMEHNEVKERISLLPIDVGKYSFRDKISGVMCMGVLGHLKRDEQEKLLYKLDKNLNINVPILIELLEPKFLVAPVGSRISVATQGRLRYETYITDIKQVGMDQWTWRLTYKVFCGKNIVSTVDSLMSWNYQSVEKILNQLTKMHFRTAKLSETLLLAIKAR